MAIDPQAAYDQTEADLRLQEGWEEAGLKEQEGNLRANTGYQENEITRNEPGVYRGESNASNKGGILTSGSNAHRKEGIAANFAARRIANQLTQTEGLTRIQREREGGKLKRTERQHGAEQTLAQERDRVARENPVVAPEPAAPAAAPRPIAVAPAGSVAQMQRENRERAIRAMRKGRGY